MIDELLQERAALYAAGALTAPEREQFELILEFHAELKAHTLGLMETAAAVTLATMPRLAARPSPALKGKLMSLLDDRAQQVGEGFVVAGPDGLVQWVNEEFTHMCGYPLEELKGKKLGPILQGELTDRSAAARMREAVEQRRPCREKILNYHKRGSIYWAEIAITPITDDEGELLWLVAREREIEAPTAV